jgi:hypothetical protein
MVKVDTPRAADRHRPSTTGSATRSCSQMRRSSLGQTTSGVESGQAANASSSSGSSASDVLSEWK